MRDGSRRCLGDGGAELRRRSTAPGPGARDLGSAAIRVGGALIYDHAAQQAFLVTLDPQWPNPFPFPYPPPYLLLLWPIGVLSYPLAQAIWSGTTLAAYAVAIGACAGRAQAALLALLAPATAVNLFYGQNGFLTAALMIGGIGLAPSRPVTGGILLGLLAYKPQFGVLIMVALAAARLWRVALGAMVGFAVFVAASLFAYGLADGLIGATPDFVAIVVRTQVPVAHNADRAGERAGARRRRRLAHGQVAAIAAAAAVWVALRRGRGGRLPLFWPWRRCWLRPMLVYDPTPVASRGLVAAEYCQRFAVEVLILGTAGLLPVGMLLDAMPPLAAAVHGALLGVILLRLRGVVPVRVSEAHIRRAAQAASAKAGRDRERCSQALGTLPP